VTSVFDLDAYLERIGLSGRPDAAVVHRAHALAIPFENLDPQRGVPVSLAEEALVDKLVTRRRGGYCFEQNLLLKLALEALGGEADLLLARVRFGAAPGAVRPRSHLVLRVRADGSTWHADVGFGAGTLLEPIPFGPGGIYEQEGWSYRVVEDGAELVLQTIDGQAWRDMYGFVPEPVPSVDVETSNWYTSTHPHSPFVTGLRVAALAADGSRTTLTSWGELSLTEERPTESDVSPVERADVPALLEERFGLPGFAIDAVGRVVPAGG
jgi:N-hydroxyarylamine O-acetyltransferase